MGSFISFCKHILIKMVRRCQATCFSPVCVVIFISICQSCFLCSSHCCWSETEKMFILAHVHINWAGVQKNLLYAERETERRKEEKYTHINRIHWTNIGSNAERLERLDYRRLACKYRIHTANNHLIVRWYSLYILRFTLSSYTLTLTMTIEFGYKLQLPRSSPWSNWFNVCVHFYYFQHPMNRLINLTSGK